MSRAAGLLAAGVVVALVAPLFAVVFLAQAFNAAAHLTELSAPPSEQALADIPAAHLAPLLDAGQTCVPVPWPVLAAIAKDEHDHGRESRYQFPPVPEPDLETLGLPADSPLLLENDDDLVTPSEVERVVARLAAWLCEGLPDDLDAAVPVSPVAGITFGNGTIHDVATAGEWATAVDAAQPGDVIRITADIGQALTYTGTSGTADAPITITSTNGAWIDPGDPTNNLAALSVRYVDHVQVAGVQVRNSGFGIWFAGVEGTATSPARIHGNTVTDVGHSAIQVSGHGPGFVAGASPSRHVRVENNTVRRTGRQFPEFGEGIYIGHGSVEWIDETSDVAVVANDIGETTAEGVDIKPGTRRILVEANLIHDLSPTYGGAISAHYTNVDPNPNAAELDRVTIRGNAIWNVTRGGPGSTDHAMWVGHGGVEVTGNYVWGANVGVRVRGEQPYGTHPITISGNVLWVPSPVEQVDGHDVTTVTGNRGPSGAPGVQEPLDQPADAPGPGAVGDADNGGGPGSSFGYVPSIRPEGYAGAEAANFMRQAIERYYPDEPDKVDEVLEIAATYGALPIAPAGRYADGPVSYDERGCPDSPVGADQTVDVYGFDVHTCIEDDFRDLMDHARADGIDLGGWAHRDPADQRRLRRQNCGPTPGLDPGDYDVPSSSCSPPTARPGSSQHEKGLAIDFTYRGRAMNTRSNTGHLWLAQNAPSHGFYNLPSEPWHWSINGR